MIYITGDCHGEFGRFSMKNFPEQKEMTREDIIIVCGDFGIWQDDKEERYWLNWLSERPFTIAFVDGNHENFDRLYSDEFPVVDFYSGKAHKIKENIYHLMRGEVFNIQGNTFFAFGGAASHDIPNGAINPDDFKSKDDLKAYCRNLRHDNIFYRVKGESWWPQEIPSFEEMKYGIKNLAEHDFKVDFIITHCLPSSVENIMFPHSENNALTVYFDGLISQAGLEFKKWYCGHYHVEEMLLGKYIIKYCDKIEQIV